MGRALLRRNPVEAGVHDDAVQPGPNSGVGAEVRGGAVCGEQGLLKCVVGVLAGVGGAERDLPEMIAVAQHELAERVGIAGDVRAQQREIAAVGPVRMWHGTWFRLARMRHRSPLPNARRPTGRNPLSPIPSPGYRPSVDEITQRQPGGKLAVMLK